MKHRPILLRVIAALVVPGLTLALFAVYSAEVLGYYGYGLFVALPFVVGLSATLLFPSSRVRSLRDVSAGSLIALAVGGVLLLFSGFEGAICLLMAAPVLLFFLLAGTVLALIIETIRTKRGTGRGPTVFLAFIMFLPLVLGMTAEPALTSGPPTRMVQTSVTIHGDIQTVWDTVIAFPPITAPPGGIFAFGIAYPIAATIEGTGAGAIRRCTFNTGDFVEPITTWDAPRQLAFTVAENPLPMREWSLYGPIDTPHLHGFMVSERGQFRLEALGDDTVRLEGATWYHQNLWPNAYWGALSDRIIHHIHRRVLEHIKVVVESEPAAVPSRSAARG